jgi:hypothetical protein
MTVKDLVRPLPGVRRFSILRQHLTFGGSASYWERNYASGETSGPGSYGALGEGKAVFLNAFVRERDVRSVIEFGCGDGHQLSLADYPQYIGLDVSPSAITGCKRQFAEDPTKSFFLYDSSCFIDRFGLFVSELAISLDVVYHLTEDAVFAAYMEHLFAAAAKFVVVYATNTEITDTAPHVRHRRFTRWVDAHSPQWRLTQVVPGPDSGPGRADFFVYERTSRDDLCIACSQCDVRVELGPVVPSTSHVCPGCSLKFDLARVTIVKLALAGESLGRMLSVWYASAMSPA